MSEKLRAEILLPSCGVAITAGIEEVPEVATCIDVYAPNTATVGDIVTVEAFLKRQVTRVGISGEQVYYRVLEGLDPIPVDSGGPITTGSNGLAQFNYTIPEIGSYRFQVVFRGKGLDGSPMISLEAAFAGCPPTGIISCAGGGFEPPAKEFVPSPQPPEDIFPPGGGGIIGGGLGQPPCGITCGQNMSSKVSKVHSLEPED